MRELILTAFYSGCLPFSPSSWGSWAAACVAAILISYFPDYGLTISLLGAGFFYIVGIIAVEHADIEEKHESATYVVIDEWAGQFLVFALVPMTFVNLLLGFAIFRIFNIWKVPPIEQLNKFKGGFAVMTDDIVVGVYSAISLAALNLIYDLLKSI